jgi:hypothetical protein
MHAYAASSRNAVGRPPGFSFVARFRDAAILALSSARAVTDAEGKG